MFFLTASETIASCVPTDIASRLRQGSEDVLAARDEASLKTAVDRVNSYLLELEQRGLLSKLSREEIQRVWLRDLTQKHLQALFRSRDARALGLFLKVLTPEVNGAP